MWWVLSEKCYVENSVVDMELLTNVIVYQFIVEMFWRQTIRSAIAEFIAYCSYAAEFFKGAFPKVLWEIITNVSLILNLKNGHTTIKKKQRGNREGSSLRIALIWILASTCYRSKIHYIYFFKLRNAVNLIRTDSCKYAFVFQ